MQKQYEIRVTDLTNELQRTRARIIEIIDDKSKLENEIHGLKLAKKDLKNDLDMKTRRI
jgi:hypothetical protein